MSSRKFWWRTNFRRVSSGSDRGVNQNHIIFLITVSPLPNFPSHCWAASSLPKSGFCVSLRGSPCGTHCLRQPGTAPQRVLPHSLDLKALSFLKPLALSFSQSPTITQHPVAPPSLSFPWLLHPSLIPAFQKFDGHSSLGICFGASLSIDTRCFMIVS